MENALSAQVPFGAFLSTSSPITLGKIAALHQTLSTISDVSIRTEHVIHGGMYARTIRIPAGVVFTGVLVKVPTVLVVHGHASVFTEDGWANFSGYGVLAGSALRQQAFITFSAVEMTMLFPTQARTVEEAEAEFTDEAENLMSRKSDGDTVTLTGE